MKLGLIFIGCTLWAGAAETDSVFIHDVNVYPVTSAMIAGASVLVTDGKIVEIGTRISAPKGIKVIEGKGLRLYPGMIDSGTELGLSEVSSERMTVDTGELGDFMPQLRALIAVNVESEHLPVVRVNGITSVMAFPASEARGGGGRGGVSTQMISGQAALMHLAGWTWEDMEINRSAAMALSFPSIVTSRGGRGGGEGEEAGPGTQIPYTEAKRTYDQQVQKLNDFFDAARQYQKERIAKAPGFKHDLKMEAMIPVLEGKVPVALSASHERCIRDALAFADKQHIKIVLVQPRDVLKVTAELKAKNIPVILGRTEALGESEDSAYDEVETVPAQLYKAGVKFAFASFNNQFARNLPFNAARAAAYGLPQEEAFKAITINAAEIWGAGDKIGSIEKGKFADLMVTNGDPLEIATQVKYLFIKGKEVELTTKQTRLYEKYMKRP